MGDADKMEGVEVRDGAAKNSLRQLNLLCGSKVYLYKTPCICVCL